MFGFNYYTPTKVVFGKGTETKVAELIEEFGGTKVLIHYGGGSVIRSGLLKRVTDTLDGAGIPYVTLGGAVPNPRLSLVYEGIELCKREGVDFLLGVGGAYLLIGYRLGAEIYLLLCTAVFAVASLLLLRWLNTRGSRLFAELP